MTKQNPTHLTFVSRHGASTIPDPATVLPGGRYSAATVVSRGYVLELTPDYLDAVEALRSDWVTAALASGRWVEGTPADHPDLLDALANEKVDASEADRQARLIEERRYGRLQRADRQAQARADAVAAYRDEMRATTAGSVL